MNYEKLRASKQGIWFAVDLLMMTLLVINLLLLIFDSLYATSAVFNFLQQNAPAVVELYAPIHANFLFLDLCFIAVFLTEFFVRWGVAIKQKEYMRWYFFPFIHWYDLVGCIPVESARIFRFLRIISVLYRLHKYQIIDFRNWALFRFLSFYYNVLIEELSDRIVVKILTDAQDEIAKGSSLLDEIADNIISPRKAVVTQWVSSLAQHLGTSISHPEQGEVIRKHIINSVAKAVRQDDQIALLNLVPVLGGNIEKRLQNTVSNVVIQSITNMLEDLDNETVSDIFDKGFNHLTNDEKQVNNEILNLIIEVLELVKAHISQKRWQEHLEERDQLKKQAAAESNTMF